MRIGIWRLALLWLAFLLTAPAASGAERDPAGRWALHASGRTLLILELKRDASATGGWAGSLIRPAHFEMSESQTFSSIEGAVAHRRIIGALQTPAGLELRIEGAEPGQSNDFLFNVAGDGFGELAFKGLEVPPLALAPAFPGESVAAIWDPTRTYAPDWERPANAEMARLFAEDQGARQNPASIDWARLGPEDEQRRVKTKALLDSGALRSGDDYYHAAFIFQHGTKPGDFLLAHSLAVIAASRGRRDATWIAAATLDRYLQSIGQPQVYGTQFTTPSGKPTTQDPYDKDLISDALRTATGVPTLAGQEVQRRRFEEIFRAK